jgi:hypothetical protein
MYFQSNAFQKELFNGLSEREKIVGNLYRKLEQKNFCIELLKKETEF